MNGAALDVVGEFPTLAAARAADVDADAVMVRLKPDTTYELKYEQEEFVEPLTPREVQVLELLAEGLANKAIADRLHISDQTVKFHVASIAGKLGAANRTDVVRRAVRRGLIAL
jgi:DNA-binding NarL/FixJ family response regulator